MRTEIPSGPTEVHQDQEGQVDQPNIMGRNFAPQPDHFSIGRRQLLNNDVAPSKLPEGIAPTSHVPYLFSPEYDKMRLGVSASNSIGDGQAEGNSPVITRHEDNTDPQT